MRKLSIITPVYNERTHLKEVIERVRRAASSGLEKELILVDDGSDDGSGELLESLKNHQTIIIHHPTNAGKGAAIRSGLSRATGDIILIHDADLELDPNDHPALIEPILKGEARIVYGTRYHGENGTFHYNTYYWGARMISWLTNLLYGSDLTDVYCGYKAYAREILQSLHLTSNGFEIEQELTIKALKARYPIAEVPVRYTPRRFEEGKKLRWKDGLSALRLIIKHQLISS